MRLRAPPTSPLRLLSLLALSVAFVTRLSACVDDSEFCSFGNTCIRHHQAPGSACTPGTNLCAAGYFCPYGVCVLELEAGEACQPDAESTDPHVGGPCNAFTPGSGILYCQGCTDPPTCVPAVFGESWQAPPCDAGEEPDASADATSDGDSSTGCGEIER